MDPAAILPTFRLRAIDNLYLAGQINGTTGYEEAAAQGVIAGMNAAFDVLQKPNVVFERSQALLGVLTDDLTRTDLTREPFRMFTSRCEYRLSVRAVGERRRREA